MLKVVLEILKFCAIAVGTISGLIGTLTDTKDKISGKTTPWGRKVVTLIVLSGVIAMATQSIESYLKRAADIEDHNQRVTDETRTQAILDKAKAIRDALGEQDKSLGKTVEGVERTAADVRSVQASQTDELLGIYRLVHPLGDLRVAAMNVSYPIDSGIGGLDSNWLGRVRMAAPKNWLLLREGADPLNPSPDREGREYHLLKMPEFDFELSRVPTQAKSDGAHLIDHGADLLFRTKDPETSLYVHIDESRIDQQVDSKTVKLIDIVAIRSRLDLYGAELIVTLPPTAPTGSKILSCQLLFGDDSAIFINFDDDNRRTNPFNEPFSNISYVKVLTERELGPKPTIGVSGQLTKH